MLSEPVALPIGQPRCRRLDALHQHRLRKRSLVLCLRQLFLQRELLTGLPPWRWSAISLAETCDEEADFALIRLPLPTPFFHTSGCLVEEPLDFVSGVQFGRVV